MPAAEVPAEHLLTGGNVAAAVVRVGDTVRRPAGPWTPAVHAFLTHLRAVGYEGAPRPLGIDAEGREVLTYVPGVVPWPDRFDLLDPDAALRRVGKLVRDLHDAAAGFSPPADAAWQRLIPPGGADLIIHHDLAPWNLVVGAAWVFIDWDTAGPGTRLWDLAYAAKGFVPLSADPAWQRPDAARRLRTLVDAYGLDERQRRDLVPLLARRARSMHDFLAEQSAAGVQPWSRLWREGHGDTWRRDADHIGARKTDWATALLD
ncbi:phosphotransferase enzyme family protein [Micromonospora sp. NBC_01813]|uniref:phosphotransferase enzyme family protein n=1 Tax=Micromonospora sp. NBC_01813 TaxID=2975988 RepID=UPI002DDB518E|nr:aminoglycoside phosphotransferase family protein [Micromonospora sp. NBC_01813]WSA10530.1 aminoglycoside phosphotransferase family protein [Micromonospora sp. NBC_01813]